LRPDHRSSTVPMPLHVLFHSFFSDFKRLLPKSTNAALSSQPTGFQICFWWHSSQWLHLPKIVPKIAFATRPSLMRRLICDHFSQTTGYWWHLQSPLRPQRTRDIVHIPSIALPAPCIHSQSTARGDPGETEFRLCVFEWLGQACRQRRVSK
jgi:hypothetical protein